MDHCYTVRAFMKDNSFCDLILFKSSRKARAHADKVLKHCAALLGIVRCEVTVVYIH